MKKKIMSLALAVVLAFALVPVFIAPANAAGTWQDAYAEFLRKSGLDTFCIYDVDGSGIPELFAGKDEEWGRNNWTYKVYTYENNRLESIGDVSSQSGIGISQNTANGIILYASGAGSMAWICYSMENSALQEEYTVYHEIGAGDEYPDKYLLGNKEITKNEFDRLTADMPLEEYPISEANIKTHITDTVTSTTPASPHPYATALQEFFKGTKDKTTAWLCDVNGDGIQEMLAWKDIVSGRYIRRYARFFFIQDGTLKTHDWDYSETEWAVYFSTKNHLACVDVYNDNDEVTHFIASLVNGELKPYEISIKAQSNNYFYNDKKISKTEYDAYLIQYGIGLPLVARPDQTDEILAMTAVPYGKTAAPTASTIYVNGKAASFEAYNIESSNYFKLRDLAKVMNGTTKQFEVGYDIGTKAVTLTSGRQYTSAGGELANGDGKAKTAAASSSKIYLNGRELSLTVYTINGNNFFKLRDLMEAINVYVGYDNTTKNITLDTGKNYAD